MAERESWLLVFTKIAVAFIVGFFAGLPEAVKTLLALQCLDVFLGLLLALSQARARSAAVWRGAAKKAGALVVIGVTHLIDPIVKLELSAIVAVYYCVSETLSILENAARLGVPLPKFLTERLEKIRDSDSR